MHSNMASEVSTCHKWTAPRAALQLPRLSIFKEPVVLAQSLTKFLLYDNSDMLSNSVLCKNNNVVVITGLEPVTISV